MLISAADLYWLIGYSFTENDIKVTQ